MKKNGKKGLSAFQMLFGRPNNKTFEPEDNNNPCVYASPFAVPGYKVEVCLTDMKTGCAYKGYFPDANKTSALKVGRLADLIISDDTISREHFEFIWQSGILYVHDLNSTSGTKVNGERISTMVALYQSDIISAGKSDFRVNWQTDNCSSTVD